MADPVRYVVFARREYSEPLTEIGKLELPAGAALGGAVTRQYGEQWLELVAIPEREITWAIREG